MTAQCGRKALVGWSLLLFGSGGRVKRSAWRRWGDSFADSLYYAMRARPDLLRSNDVQLRRWSRPS